MGIASAAPSAHAQTPQQLEEARRLFQEAFKDEADGRCEDALRKFQEVAKIKESASVKYRIAKTEACLGRYREARDNMRALAASKDSLPPKDKNIADSAAAEVVDLDKKVPKLTVKVQDKAPSDTRITLDGAPVPSTGTPKPVEVDQGDHTVVATATGMKPFEQKVKVSESANETVTVQFEPEQPVNPNPNPNPDPNPEKDKKTGDGPGVLPYALLIGGGLGIFVGSMLLIVREGTVSDIEKTCPIIDNIHTCPTRTQADIKDKQAQSDLYLPLGVTFIAVGAIAAGAGVYFLAKPTKAADTPANGTQPPPSGRSFHVGPPGIAPVRGGMMVGVGATF
jgi:hypothetical protein